ncbi:MAG: hypothetical protein CSA76_00860, partial [Spirochaetales bacterium]
MKEKGELDKYLKRVEKQLAAVLPEQVDTVWLEAAAGQSCGETEPRQADCFLEPGRALLRRGGKRWRPLVTVLTCEALGGGERADALVPLTEIPHNGSLIVDDIEDSSAVRRGGKAVHLEFGEDLAINMGNLMYFLPTLVWERADFPPEICLEMTHDWMAAMRRLHLGQGYDIFWHRESELFPEPAAYLRMCRFKTGSLASLAARLGARAALGAAGADVSGQRSVQSVAGSASMIGERGGITAAAERAKSGAGMRGETSSGIAEDFSGMSEDYAAGRFPVSDRLVKQLGDVWEDIGTGFQILDDVQNLTTGIPGKDRGDDIVEGKKSLPVILHVQKHPE